MKQLDKETVLEIIEMIDAQISMNNTIISTDSTLRSEDLDAIANESWGIEKLRDHLQSFIEETECSDPKPSCPACKSQDPDHLCML
jgi:hypothetical protein